MIDYSKLKLAHDRVQEYIKQTDVCSALNIIFRDDGVLRYEFDNGEKIKLTTIDGLLDYLEKLTHPNPKYKIADMVWTYTYGEINCWVIDDIGWESENNDFRLHLKSTHGKASILQKNCYSTRMELIEAQIEYWQSLREQQDEYCEHSGVKLGKRICQHESDGYCYDDNGKSIIGYELNKYTQQKCKKCGDFYR